MAVMKVLLVDSNQELRRELWDLLAFHRIFESEYLPAYDAPEVSPRIERVSGGHLGRHLTAPIHGCSFSFSFRFNKRRKRKREEEWKTDRSRCYRSRDCFKMF